MSSDRTAKPPGISSENPVPGFGPVERERAAARQQLEEIRTRLRAGTACSADHRKALDAVLLLPKLESERWLEEIRTGFIPVYARERKR